MENQSGTNSVSSRSNGWMVGPAFDLLFLANIAWPLLLLPGFSTDRDTAIDFWQVYFLTLPHRWITLFLVTVDADRRGSKTGVMVAIALLLGLVVLCSHWGFGWAENAFVCLGFVDYLWNGWHFASQHAGVLRIYSRKSGDGRPRLERWGIRSFVFLVILRTSSELLWPRNMTRMIESVPAIDWLILLIPLLLILVSILPLRRERYPKIVYLLSVLTLYSCYLLASHYAWHNLFLCLATAAALFHAVEYLAIVTHYAHRRRSSDSPSLMRSLSIHWSTTLTCFIIGLGTLGVVLADVSGPAHIVWQGLNLWAALVHYAFDGMIWKLRQPATSRSLGIA